MNTRKFIIASLLVITGATPLAAQSLAELYNQALEKDPKLRAAMFRSNSKHHTRRAARSGLLPSLRGEYETLDTGQEIRRSDNVLFQAGKSTFPTWSYLVTLRQPIIELPTLERYEQAKLEHQRSRIEVELGRQDTIARLSTLYIQALAGRDKVELLLAEEEAIDKHLELAEEKRLAELGTMADQLDAKARLAAVKADTITAKNEVDDSLQGLVEIVGRRLKRLARLPVTQKLVPPRPTSAEPWVRRAARDNLTVALARFDTQIAHREVRRQNSAHYPSVSFVARKSERDAGGSVFGGGSDTVTDDAVFRVEMPFYQGEFIEAKTNEAVNLRDAAHQELEGKVRQAERQARQAFLGIVAAMDKARALEEAVKAQEMALEAKAEGFRSGLYTSVHVLDAQRDLFKARREAAQARYDYLVKTLLLNQSVGTLTEDHLAVIDRWLK